MGKSPQVRQTLGVLCIVSVVTGTCDWTRWTRKDGLAATRNLREQMIINVVRQMKRKRGRLQMIRGASKNKIYKMCIRFFSEAAIFGYFEWGGLEFERGGRLVVLHAGETLNSDYFKRKNWDKHFLTPVTLYICLFFGPVWSSFVLSEPLRIFKK